MARSWTIVTLAPGLALLAGSLAASDLEVLCIERNPKCESYRGAVNYRVNQRFTDDYLPYAIDYAAGLRGQGPETKRWPEPDETVTFTAHVHNWGPYEVGGFRYRWSVDGVPAEEGDWSKALGVGAEAAPTFRWGWKTGDHKIRFAIVGAGDFRPANDALEDWTEGLHVTERPGMRASPVGSGPTDCRRRERARWKKMEESGR